jgi:mevalonate kinase
MTVASAPGKLVIVGDYAVLEGAPAIATTVGIRAKAQVTVTDARDSVFIDLAGGKAYNFSVEPGVGLCWADESPAERGMILEVVINTCYELLHLPGPLPALRISMNTDAFFRSIGGSPVKLGVGSSAAALVALTGALVAALGIPVERPSLLSMCHAAHRRFQGGLGSGIDVSAALYGGVVGVTAGRGVSGPEAETLGWPKGLAMLPLWSGASSSTPELLRRFARYRETKSDAFNNHMRHLTRFARQADATWRSESVVELMSALAGFDDALRALDSDAGIGINTEAHERLRGLVERNGAVYKTSGAGGGDFGLAISDSTDVIDAVRADAIDSGYLSLDQKLGVDGLTIGG